MKERNHPLASNQLRDPNTGMAVSFFPSFSSARAEQYSSSPPDVPSQMASGGPPAEPDDDSKLPVNTRDAGPDATPDDPRVAANLQALLQAGIQQPTAGRLARLGHLSPEYIRAHVEAAQQQGYALGTAVSRMQKRWPMPPDARQRSVEDKLSRFLSDDWRPRKPPVRPGERVEQTDDPTFDAESHHDGNQFP